MKTHWKKLDNPNYLGAYSLLDGRDNPELTTLIERVVMEEVKTNKGAEQCRVMYLKDSKPMILNKTNSKIIEKIYNTPYIEDWKGKYITIYVVRIKAFGEYIDALRIKPNKPKKPTLDQNHKDWAKAVEAIKNGYTIAQLEQRYFIPEIIKTKLNETV